MIYKLSTWFENVIAKRRAKNRNKQSRIQIHNRYICYMPAKALGLFSFLFRFIFSRIQIDDTQLTRVRKVADQGIIVYATKYKSNFEFLFLHIRFRQLGLPFPEIGFYFKLMLWQSCFRLLKVMAYTIGYFFTHWQKPSPYTSGYIKNELTEGRSGLLALINRRLFYKRFVKDKTDPMSYLIEMQQSLDKPIFIVPQLIFFGRKAERSEPSITDILFGSEEKPGKLRRIFLLLKSPKKIFMEISEPFNLKEYLSRPDIVGLNIQNQAFSARRHLIQQINTHRQSITGPSLKSRQEIKENILTGYRFQQRLEKYAEANNLSKQQVHKEADDYIEEIAANYSLNWIKAYDITLRIILKLMFEGMIYDKQELNRIKEKSKEAPLILVPCHKSHLDYLILSWIFYNNHMPCPLIAAGKNLSFWPLGTIFRGGGAFFLRRTFKGAELYARVFEAYIYKMIEEGFNIEFFIEGGRSRTGKLLAPKIGFLAMLIDAMLEGACNDLIFVPTNIGYDRILEEKAYIHEIEGGKKEAENLKQVVGARKFLKKRYGKVYIGFSAPISLKSYLHGRGLQIDTLKGESKKELLRELAFSLINSIDAVGVATPYALVSSALLNSMKKRLAYRQLYNHLEIYLNYLVSQEMRLSDTLLSDHVTAFDMVIRSFIQRRLIDGSLPEGSETTIPPETMFKVNESKRSNLEYYKNTAIIFFIPAVFTALAILENDAFLFSAVDINPQYVFLQKFFKHEFAYDLDKPADLFIRKNIKAFIDEAIIVPHKTLPDTYNLTSSGFRKLKVFAAFLTSFFESYWIVLNFFIRYPENAVQGKERIKKIQSIGSRMFKRHEIERPEALSKISYINAERLFREKGVDTAEGSDLLQFYSEKVQKYLNLLTH